MKPAPYNRLIMLSAFAGLAATSSLNAVTYFWDGNDTTANADGGSGTWNTVLTNWDTLATAGVAIAWPSSGTDNDATFGGTAGTVTIDAGGVTANDISFTTANYIVQGGDLTLNGTTPTITNAVAASISSNLIGSAGLTKSGNGTLTLGGNNSNLTGALVLSGATTGNNGGIVANSANAISGFTSITIQNNSFLQLQGVTISSAVPISVFGGGGSAAPLGALRGGAGTTLINSAVSLGDGAVRFGNSGTSTTFAGAVTAAAGSGFGLSIRQANNQGVIFSNTSNYWEGATVLGDGSVYFQPGTLPSTSNLQLSGSGNTWFETSGTFTRSIGSGAGQVQFNSTASRINGFSARGGDLTVNLGGASAALTWGSGGFVGDTLGLAGANATHTLTWVHAINLSASTRTVSVSNGSATIDAIMSGALTNGTLQVLGAGTLQLSGNNTLVTINKGTTTADSGTLILSGSNTFSTTTLAFGTASENRGAIRLENNNALGGINTINGGSGTGGAIAQVQLANNVTISGIGFNVGGRSNNLTTGASLVNVSGNNTWTGNVSITNTGGSYGIRSDSGRLTISGSLRNTINSARVWSLTGAGDIVLSGQLTSTITGATLGIDKSGSGTLTISGNTNNYAGGTTVTAGGLVVSNTSGSATGTGTVAMTGGSRLSGTGSIAGNVSIGNSDTTLSPAARASGNAMGIGGNLTFASGSIFNWDLTASSSNPGVVAQNGSYGQLAVTGTVTGNSKFVISLLGGSGNTTSFADAFWRSNKSWNNVITSATADLASVFTSFGGAGVNANGTVTGDYGQFSFNGSTLNWTAVPEPSNAFLVGSLFLSAALRRRRSVRSCGA